MSRLDPNSLEFVTNFYDNPPMIPKIPPLDLDNPPEYVTSLIFALSAEEEFTMEAEIDSSALKRTCGFDAAPFPDATGFSLIFSKPYQVQRKRHKKKRINKKWAKRYGYVTKFKRYRMDEVYFKSDIEGRYDFYKQTLEMQSGMKFDI